MVSTIRFRKAAKQHADAIMNSTWSIAYQKPLGVNFIGREFHSKRDPPHAALAVFEDYVGDVRFLGGM